MRTWAIVVASVAGAWFGAACDGAESEQISRAAQVYVATIREVLDEMPDEPDKPDVLPVVYVISVGESDIPADVQAEVTGVLNDDAELRFADERAQAVLEDEEHAPVRDDGVLVAVGEPSAVDDPVEVSVEVYRTDLDRSRRVLTIARRSSSQWTVTSSSVMPVDEA